MRYIPKKLKSGYFVIVNELGETVKRKPDYNTMLFEFRDSAKITASQFKFCGLPEDLTF